MTATVNKVSIGDLFWFKVTSNLFNFGPKLGLQQDIHFSVSIPENNQYANFHLTRNIGEPKNKPQITICKIHKQELDKLAEVVAFRFYKSLLEPVNLQDLKYELGGVIEYIPYQSLQDNKTEEQVRNIFSNGLKNDIGLKRKGTRFELRSGFEDRLEQMVLSPEMVSIVEESIVELKDNPDRTTGGGMVITSEGTIQLLFWNGQWYKMNFDHKPFDLFCSIVANDTLAHLLREKMSKAIEILKWAKTYQDTQQFDKPIRITLTRSTR